MARTLENKHHIFFRRKKWNDSEYSYKLRNHPYFIVDVDLHRHNIVHEIVPSVPIPSKVVCEYIITSVDEWLHNGHLKPSDPISLRLELVINILSYVEDPTVLALEKQKAILC